MDPEVMGLDVGWCAVKGPVPLWTPKRSGNSTFRMCSIKWPEPMFRPQTYLSGHEQVVYWRPALVWMDGMDGIGSMEAVRDRTSREIPMDFRFRAIGAHALDRNDWWPSGPDRWLVIGGAWGSGDWLVMVADVVVAFEWRHDRHLTNKLIKA